MSKSRSRARRRNPLRLERLEDRTLFNVTPAPLTGFNSLAIDRTESNPSQILVRFRQGQTPDAAAILPGTTLGLAIPLVSGLYTVRLDPGVSVRDAIGAYNSNPSVAYAEPDYIVRAALTPNDPSYNNLWGLNNTGQTGGTPGADIDAPLAWDITTGSSSTVVAVIDTGIDYNHPDLAANMWTNPGEFGLTPGVDDDGNGIVDDIFGADFVNNDGNPQDDYGHGTHVAGTIGAKGNNSVGVVGVNWNVKLMALKFLGSDGSGSIAGAVSALNYAVAKGATISNNSWGGTGSSQALLDAINASASAGHIFVCAAGNNGTNNDTSPFYPAAYPSPNLVSVAATTHTDGRAGFSNFGLTSVDLGAPGDNVYSTVPNNGYAYLSGTSMASPHVAGVVALVRTLHPTWSYSQVIDQVLSSTDPIPAMANVSVTGGRLNAARAVGIDFGPRVVSQTPSGSLTGSVSSLQLNFGEPIQAGTFTTADIVSFTGPGGVNLLPQITSLTGSGQNFTINFTTQTALGAYSLVVGPDIRDDGPNHYQMDQDRDGVNGEVPQDRYTAAFAITNEVTFHSDDVPAPVLSLYETVSFLTINQHVTINDINLRLTIDFPDDGDIAIFVVSPQGTSVDLSIWNGAGGSDYDNTLFDDQAATSILAGSPPYSGSYRPEEPLSALNGQDAFGTWELHIYDLPWSGFFNDGWLDAWSVTITPPASSNQPPDAVNDTASTNEDTAVTVSVLANDTDPNGDTLTVQGVTQPAHGTAAMNANGTVTYTPAGNYNGSDSFTYTISDGHGGSDTATVNLTVAAVNDPPVAVADSATTAANTAVTVPVLANDNDPDGDALSVSAVTQGGHGTVGINANGTVTYTPAQGYSGNDQFTYTVSDGNGGTAVGTVSLTVTAVPASQKYDFGTPASPLGTGYTRVSHTTGYTAALGYGWLSGAIDARDRGQGTDLQRDFNFAADGTFATDLPNGTYAVTVLMGDASSGHDQMGVYLEGALADTVTTNAGQWATRTLYTTVSDGQLTLRLRDLGGSDGNAVLNAIDIVPGVPSFQVTGSTPAGQGGGPIDHFRLTFSAPVQSGSFTLDDVVSLTGPAGAITPTGVTMVNSTTYDVTFPSQSAAGAYALVVGPQILDASGAAMDQNQNGTPGEVPGDRFTASFTVLAAGVRKYDFGTPASPLGTGYTRISHTTGYTAALGYGWLSGAIDSRDRGQGTDLQRDFNFAADGTFATDLPNGTYAVTVLMGDASSGHDQMGVYLEGALADTVTTNAGQWATRTLYTAVSDGQLTLRLRDLGGSDGNAVLNAIDIAPGVAPFQVTASAPGGQVPGPVDRVTLTFSGGVQDNSFTLADVVSLTGPSGAITPTGVNKINATTYEVVFPPQSAAGAYALVVGPQILDAGGNPLDQNGNGTAGEVPGDRYTATFTLESSARDKFDFGTSDSPLASGYRRVTEATTYSAAQGFGWVAGAIDSRDRGQGTDLQRDFCFTGNGTFVVDAASGTYTLTVVMGDAASGHDQMGVFVEGAQVDSVTTATGQWVTRTYTVTVSDGQLTLRLTDLGGSDGNVVINSLDIVPAP